MMGKPVVWACKARTKLADVVARLGRQKWLAVVLIA